MELSVEPGTVNTILIVAIPVFALSMLLEWKLSRDHDHEEAHETGTHGHEQHPARQDGALRELDARPEVCRARARHTVRHVLGSSHCCWSSA